MSLPQINIGNGMLGDAAVYSVEVVQELNQHWWCTVVCRQSAEAPVPVQQLIGQPIEIQTSDEAGQNYLHFSGFVQDVELRLEVWGNSAAVLRCVSESLRLDVAAHNQYYLAATLTTLASTIGGRTGLSIAVKTPASKPLNYAQFGETDFSFLARVVDDYGGWFRPTPEGLEIQNAFQPGGKLAWRDMEGLLHFQIAAELVAPSISGAHYDHHVAQSQRFTAVSKQPACFDGAAQFVGAMAVASQRLPPAFEPNRARAMTLEDYRQQLEGESERLLGSAVLGRGTSRAQALKAGNTVEITGLPGAQGTYGLVQVTHRWSREGYSNSFRCTPWKQYRHRRPPEVPEWTGLVSARVVAHDDPKKMGRLQVRYAWQGEGETHWARMMSSHAGQERGTMMMPEVGDEVAVLFEDGDPERPLIVGSLWNGVHQQQRGGFFTPTSDIAGNNIKRLITKSGNRMQLVDTPGQETVLFATPHNANITLTEKSTASGVPMISLASAGDIVLSAPNGRVHIKSKFFSREIGIPDPFPCASSDTLDKMTPSQRAAYDSKLAALIAAKAVAMPDGAAKRQLLETADRYQRDGKAQVMAQISASVYDDPKHPEDPPPGWKRLDPKDMPPGLNDPKLWNDTTTGYHAGLFENEDGSIVMAERGTVPYNSQNTGKYGAFQDDQTDFKQSQGEETPQYDQGMKLAKAVQDQYGSSFVGITGHSLGGGRAAADSSVTGVPATTFNAAGLHANTIAPYGTTLDRAAPRINNYDNPGQFLDQLHGVNIAGLTAPDPAGSTHKVVAIGKDGKPMQFMPLTGGSKIADITIGAMNLSQAVERHLMDTVKRSLAKEREEDAASLCKAIH